MTTIASDGITVAYDSRSTLASGTIVSDTTDKCKVIDGVSYIGCGSDPDIDRLIAHYLSGKPSSVKYECDVFMSNGDGHLYRIDVDDGSPFKYDTSQHGNIAIG